MALERRSAPSGTLREMPSHEVPQAEAERRLAAAADRHREVVAAMKSVDRSAVSEEAAIRALARGVQLVAFTIRQAAASDVPLERIVELSGWDGELVRATIGEGAEARMVARVMPEGVDPQAVAQASASFEATARVEAVLRAILADVDDAAWSPAGADLDDLADRLESLWRSWRQALGRHGA